MEATTNPGLDELVEAIIGFCVDKVVWTRVKRREWIPLPKITTIPWMFNDVHDAA